MLHTILGNFYMFFKSLYIPCFFLLLGLSSYIYSMEICEPQHPYNSYISRKTILKESLEQEQRPRQYIDLVSIYIENTFLQKFQRLYCLKNNTKDHLKKLLNDLPLLDDGIYITMCSYIHVFIDRQDRTIDILSFNELVLLAWDQAQKEHLKKEAYFLDKLMIQEHNMYLYIQPENTIIISEKVIGTITDHQKVFITFAKKHNSEVNDEQSKKCIINEIVTEQLVQYFRTTYDQTVTFTSTQQQFLYEKLFRDIFFDLITKNKYSFYTALFYMRKILKTSPSLITQVHPIPAFIVCWTVAQKFCLDQAYRNKSIVNRVFQHINSITNGYNETYILIDPEYILANDIDEQVSLKNLRNFNTFEIKFLNALSYNLHLNDEALNDFMNNHIIPKSTSPQQHVQSQSNPIEIPSLC
ncbi:MAG: hypothetical protein UU47_C0018G0002 [candidate division TM6 bacterium GW2011_GWE2_41_16]|nr:MAG: hypothetical protein UU47_C0018G0002 [candidate division TM6 bacterium GW2011_GWE2_41_16]